MSHLQLGTRRRSPGPQKDASRGVCWQATRQGWAGGSGERMWQRQLQRAAQQAHLRMQLQQRLVALPQRRPERTFCVKYT